MARFSRANSDRSFSAVGIKERSRRIVSIMPGECRAQWCIKPTVSIRQGFGDGHPHLRSIPKTHAQVIYPFDLPWPHRGDKPYPYGRFPRSGLRGSGDESTMDFRLFWEKPNEYTIKNFDKSLGRTLAGLVHSVVCPLDSIKNSGTPFPGQLGA